jgi:nucleoside-diphosphate-sugar epimerase
MNTLIIGGDGYIGSELNVYMKTVGMKCTSYGNRNLDFNLLEKSYIDKFDAIILLAGNSSVPSCKGELVSPWNNNVRNFANLMAKVEDQIVIYAGSSSIYANCGDKVCDEGETCLSYMNNYDLTKMVLDQVAQNYINAGKRLLGFRFGTVVGSSPITRIDTLVNSMTFNAMRDREIYVANPEITRPYVSIIDVCRAIYVVLASKFKSGIYNLANENFRIIDYANAVKEHTQARVIDRGITQGVYNFKITSEKFKRDYSFEFTTNALDNLIEKLMIDYSDHSHRVVKRDTYFAYSG